MKEYTINDKKRICFLVKKGEANDIVIDQEALQNIDLKRMYEMEAQGGELMRVMRDTTLDNGVNALVMYKDLFKIVPVERTKKDVSNEIVNEKISTDVTLVKKRGRGRPKKDQ